MNSTKQSKNLLFIVLSFLSLLLFSCSLESKSDPEPIICWTNISADYRLHVSDESGKNLLENLSVEDITLYDKINGEWVKRMDTFSQEVLDSNEGNPTMVGINLEVNPNSAKKELLVYSNINFDDGLMSENRLELKGLEPIIVKNKFFDHGENTSSNVVLEKIWMDSSLMWDAEVARAGGNNHYPFIEYKIK